MTAVAKLYKPTFGYLESEVSHFHDTLIEINRLRLEIMFTNENDDENIGGGRSSYISKPTERTATRLATDIRLNKLEEMAGVIEKVYNALPEEQQKLVKLKYWTKPQTLTWDGIAQKLFVTKRTAMRWRDDFIYQIADELGLR